MDEKINFTAGVRRQRIRDQEFDTSAGVQGAQTALYDKAVFSPAYTVLVRPFQFLSLYANDIQGLQEGPVAPLGNNPPLVNAGQVFPPTVTVQKEVGAKLDFGNLAFTLAAFDIAQPESYISGNVFVVNGKQRNRGLEFTTFGEIVPGVRPLGGFTIFDARLEGTQAASMTAIARSASRTSRPILGWRSTSPSSEA